MRLATIIALGSAVIVGASGCKDYLTGPGLGKNDPNNIASIKDPGALYVGLEALQMLNFEAQWGRTEAMYMQQVAGIARQQAGFDLYNMGASDVDPTYNGVFGQGGASEARRIQGLAQSLHDSLYVGIAKVWEAFIIGEAASTWGAIPYSQAFNSLTYPQPKYDDQLTAYHEVEVTLDSALVYLNCATADVTPGSTNFGPTGTVAAHITRNAEIIYANRSPVQLKAVYAAVAHTLKARFYLHQVEVDPTKYDSALAQAQQGISSPADDWNWFAASNPTSNNVWAQFQGARGDLGPGAALIHLMKSRIASGLDVNTDRFTFYFLDASGAPCPLTGAGLLEDGGCTGNRPGANANFPGGEGNSSFNSVGAVAMQLPAITYTETQLIIAEAALQTGATATAQTALNNARTHEVYGADLSDGFTNCSPQCAFVSQPVIPVTLQNIIEEKYIDMYLNVEVWSDWKRTCFPYLAPAATSVVGTTLQSSIPGRFPYGITEINVNPNTPSVGSTANNADQPNACPALNYTAAPVAY
ncbi:MAG TPA: SusD/RagB family nutrient-binding outer membrane lipoprotein [Gemmatimonadaceae bacterium]|jgi:hypothetical protein|nr:SusD/RagB family nutrient-binding outer membrane lipoprotein [Gemmatimonadaceae bacterium]